MRKLFKVLEISLFSILCLVLLITATGLAVLRWPRLIVNPKTLNFGAKMARKNGMGIAWNTVHVDARSISFFEKYFVFDFDGLCVQMPKPAETGGCFEHFDAEFEVSFSGFKPRFTQIGPIAILGGDVFYRQTPTVAKKAEKPAGKFEWPPQIMKAAVIKKVHLELKKLRVALDKETLEGTADLANNPAYQGIKWRFRATERTEAGPQSHRGKADVQVSSANTTWRGPWELKGSAGADFRDGKSVRATTQVSQAGENDFKIGIRGSFLQGKRLAVAQLSGEYSPDRVAAHIKGTVRNATPMVPKISIENCDISLTRLARESAEGRLALTCPVGIKLKFPPIKFVPNLKLPTETQMRLTADLETHYYPSMDTPLKGSVGIELGPILNPIFEGNGKMVAQVAGIPNEFPKKWQLDSNIAALLRIPEFGEVVKLLDKTPWAVPAPLNVLRGSIEFAARGQADLAEGALPVRLRTRLASVDEKLDIDGDGQVKFHRTPDSIASELKADVVLANVKLALPRLDFQAPPRLFPDPRIHLPVQAAGQVAGPTSSFTYDVTIRTLDGEPVQILSNLAQAPIPISMNVRMVPESPPMGTIAVANFPVEFYQHKATVEKFNLDLSRDGEAGGHINGAIRFNYTDYVVRVLLNGTVKEPQIHLVSDPPVPEKQLVAVLLFGRPLDELDPDQTQSASSAKAALTDGAMSLGTFMLLGSTPIESIGYDPGSGGVVAKVKLGSGTSLNVGADGSGLAQIGIRKRLGKYWTITTDVAHATTTTDRAVEALLQWSNRY